MTDREIAEKLNMVRKTVQYQRTSSLKALKKNWRTAAMNKMITNDRSLVPFPVIAAASSGDVTAMDIVLKHYSGYISALCNKNFI